MYLLHILDYTHKSNVTMCICARAVHWLHSYEMCSRKYRCMTVWCRYVCQIENNTNDLEHSKIQMLKKKIRVNLSTLIIDLTHAKIVADFIWIFRRQLKQCTKTTSFIEYTLNTVYVNKINVFTRACWNAVYRYTDFTGSMQARTLNAQYLDGLMKIWKKIFRLETNPYTNNNE